MEIAKNGSQNNSFNCSKSLLQDREQTVVPGTHICSVVTWNQKRRIP